MLNTKLAFLFPGQGSQSVGMGKDLAAAYSVAQQTFDEADAALGYKLSQLCFEGPEEVLKVCQEAAQDGVCSPANLNSPDQTVISGSKSAVERAAELAKSRGAKKVVMLAVSAPFHCALMQPAQARLAEDLRKLNFQPMQVP